LKRSILLAVDQVQLDNVRNMLQNGWAVDPELGVQVLDCGVIYHLVKYETGDDPHADVITSIKSVPIEMADDLISKGYKVRDTFSKSVTLVRMGAYP
jgi:hypothetical protein